MALETHFPGGSASEGAVASPLPGWVSRSQWPDALPCASGLLTSVLLAQALGNRPYMIRLSQSIQFECSLCFLDPSRCRAGRKREEVSPTSSSFRRKVPRAESPRRVAASQKQNQVSGVLTRHSCRSILSGSNFVTFTQLELTYKQARI